MVQGYYTLEESAHILGMSSDELKQLARKGEIRSFQDRGTWRFRIQDIQEMARRRTGGSDLELAVGESMTPMPTDSPAPRSPRPKKTSDDVFGFSLDADESAPISGVSLDKPPASSAGKSGVGLDRPPASSVGKSGAGLDKPPASGIGKKGGSSKRLTQNASDSEVRLVNEGSDITFHVPTDSSVKLGDAGPKSSQRSSKTGMSGPKSPRSSRSKLAETPADSGVRLVPDSDSDVRILGADDDEQIPIGETPPKGPTDSAIRLEDHIPLASGGEQAGSLTEEIDLDAELAKDESAKRKMAPPKKSPFDLSESELDLSPLPPAPKSGIGKASPQEIDADSSSDFELTPAAESSSPLEPGSDEFTLASEDDEAITLGEEPADSRQGPLSGINLGHPADSGISLEQSEPIADDGEFELTLEPEDSTPKPAKPSTPKPGSGRLAEAEDDSDSSEFELSLDADAAAAPDADSEFELTLDDTGGLVEDGEAADKDIFETDFEVPALEDESGSEAVAVEDAEADMASSDFELAIPEEGAEDESGSEVVALDDEIQFDEEGEPISARRRGKKTTFAVDADAEFGDVADAGDDIVIEEDQEPVVQTVTVQQAPWGIFPVAVLLPCVIVMALLGMMGYELVQTQQGYKPGMLTKAIGGLIDGKK